MGGYYNVVVAGRMAGIQSAPAPNTTQMSAEPKQTSSTEAWTTWQNQVVQERFALRRCLGWTDHSAVFLTEHKAKSLAEAAIKFVRADAPHAQSLLMRWQAALNLSHPHLVQLFEVGRYESGGHDYQFVVMEYGDQTLAQILRRRPLSAEELQELLPPVLEALTFLHRRQLVHGQLKPCNFLAVGDELKLASDTIRPAGQDHATSTAGDVWNFGATLVEAVTARARISIDQRFDVASLPAGLPASLVDTVQRCLSPSPADRPSIIELRAEHKPAGQQKVSQEVTAPSRPADTVSRAISPIQPAPSASREATLPRPAQAATRPQPVPAAPQVAAAPQAANSAVRVTIPPQAVPMTPQESAPLQPVQTASRVTVSFYTVPSASPEIAQPKPAPSASRESPSPQPANTGSREIASSQVVSTAPKAVAPAQPVPSTPREVASPQIANATPRVVAPAQPVSSAPRDAAPRPANSASNVAAPSQPASITSREVARPQPAPSTAREVTPPQPSAAREPASPKPTPNIPRVAVPPQAASPPSREAAPSEGVPRRHLSILGIAAGALLLMVAVWIGWRSAGHSPAPLQPAAVPVPALVAPSVQEKVATTRPPVATPVSPPQAQPAAPSTTSVLHEVTPTVPDKIQNKIQGRVYVTVRVLVDPAGNVMGVLMENAGPSKYFARLSDQAAREWQFVASDTDADRVWLLRFEYSRNGVSVRTFEQ